MLSIHVIIFWGGFKQIYVVFSLFWFLLLLSWWFKNKLSTTFDTEKKTNRLLAINRLPMIRQQRPTTLYLWCNLNLPFLLCRVDHNWRCLHIRTVWRYQMGNQRRQCRSGPDLLLCLCVLRRRAPLARGPSSYQ